MVAKGLARKKFAAGGAGQPWWPGESTRDPPISTPEKSWSFPWTADITALGMKGAHDKRVERRGERGGVRSGRGESKPYRNITQTSKELSEYYRPKKRALL